MAKQKTAAAEAESATSPSGYYKRLLQHAFRYWPFLLIAVVAMAIDAAATAGFTRLMQPLLDEAFLAQDREVIGWMPVWVILIILARSLGGLISVTSMTTVGRSVIRDLRQQVFQRYLILPTAYYDAQSAGSLISRQTYDIEQVAQACTDAITILFRDSFYILGLLTVMLLQSVRLTLFVLIIGPVIALIIGVVSRRFRRLSRKIQDSMSDVTHHTNEIVNGHREVKIYNAYKQEADNFDRINSDNRSQHLKLITTKMGTTALVQIMAGLALAGIIFLVAVDPKLSQITPGQFVAFMIAMLGILPSLKKLTNVHPIIQRGIAAAESVYGVLDLPGETDVGKTPLQRAKGTIAFDGISLSYDNNQTNVLEDVSFTARPGSITAIVGRSGSGKTSLISLLARFYQPRGGRILLDGHDISEYGLSDLRHQIALVSQQVVLFNDTVAANIAYGSLAKASREDIEQAAEKANAKEFIDELPQGFDTILGASGVQLSGGQRQRIAIARAILKNAPILILDEATSALDSRLAQSVQVALQTVMEGKTTLVIAHRLSTIEQADQVIVLDQGRIVEQGSHQELLEKDGYYAALHEVEFRKAETGSR